MAAPREVIDLIERFERNRDTYRSSEYNETQVRLEFIDPFFKALGWDMYNEAGYAKAHKDLVHEDAIKIGKATKAPDYAFRIGKAIKFFVESKQPGVDIKNDPDPAYQLCRCAVLCAELDAYYAKLYGLTEEELRYILDPKDIHGEDFPSETFRVLKEKETRLHGEYRTKRLVLEAWDQMKEVQWHDRS